MLKGFFVSILLIAFTTAFAQQDLYHKVHKYPDYQTVVNHFYDNYWPNYKISNTVQIEFARNPKGWYLILNDFVEPENTKQYVVWNKWGYHNPKKFIKRKTTTDTTEFGYTQYQNRAAQLTPYLERMFKIQTYFGYRGWAEDIVKHLAPKRDKLNDGDLYSLGRAYSSISMTLIRKYSEPTEDQLAQYLDLQSNAQSCFKQLAERSPRFSTIVGKIQTKYANEVVQNYLDLWMVQNEKMARQQLIPNIYPPEILANARNYLRNCSIHAILLTSGDNDTYPLWYVQVTENFRTDVSVVNLSLLGLPKYLEAIKRGMNGVVVNLNIPHQIYDTIDFLYFDSEKDIVSGSDILEWANNQSASQQINAPFSEVYFDCPRKPNEPIKGRATRFYYKSDLAVLDMYYSNGRTIEFSNNVDEPSYFVGHFILRGMVRTIDMCADYAVDHNAFFDFLQMMEIESYLDPNNFPTKIGDTTYVDDLFVETVYINTLLAYSDAIDIKDEERIAFYELSFLNMMEHWAVHPQPFLIEQFERLRNR